MGGAGPASMPLRRWRRKVSRPPRPIKARPGSHGGLALRHGNTALVRATVIDGSIDGPGGQCYWVTFGSKQAITIKDMKLLPGAERGSAE